MTVSEFRKGDRVRWNGHGGTSDTEAGGRTHADSAVARRSKSFDTVDVGFGDDPSGQADPPAW